MQQVVFTTEMAKQAPYTNAIIKEQATKKIFLFAAILLCLVAAINI